MSLPLAKIVCVVGARPNFMKIAPVMRALATHDQIAVRLVHTGQHYDADMSTSFFSQLGIPEPDVNLEVGSGSHAVQTAEIMRRFEPVIDADRPDAILVVGDVNSTIACALVAAKKDISVIHVEAGLRSYDRSMPEEVNRVLTDQLSDLLFTTERHARDNLAREGIDKDKVHFVGNVMIDTLKANLDKAVPPEKTLSGRDLSAGYGVVTLHRPSNVDDPVVLGRLVKTLSELSRQLLLVFPMHPRTAAHIESSAMLRECIHSPNIVTRSPLSYLEMLGLMSKARLVMTDSGGIQEETTALGVPCITMRENTERPITVEEGTNTIVGTDVALICSTFERIMKDGGKAGRVPEGWDGKASIRIAAIINSWLIQRKRGA